MKIIPKSVKAAVNRLAHAAGASHEAETRRIMLARLEAMRAAGMDEAGLLACVKAWNTTTEEHTK